MIAVKAKVSGFHPVSGLCLEQGRQYDVEERFFSDQVFERVGEQPDPAAPDVSTPVTASSSEI